MKKILLFLLACALVSFANEGSSSNKEIFAGMKNSRYAFVGGSYKNFGLSLESSIFVQKANQQYGRIAAFYKSPLAFNLNVYYALFAGIRYDGAYYDVGGKLNINGSWIENRIGLDATMQISNDSEIGTIYAYELRGILRILSETALFAGTRTIPEFRMKEHRGFAGISFTSGNLSVCPEVSIPLSGKLQLSRISVSFIYKTPF